MIKAEGFTKESIRRMINNYHARRVRPLGNRLVVRRWPEVDQHESGLWLPSDAREKPQLGDVLSVGPGARHNDYSTHRLFDHIPIDISPGEVVVFEKMVSNDHEYKVGDERLLILPYSTIYCAISGLSIAERNS